MIAQRSRITMSYTEKIDVLDLIINILREHEEKLDELVERLEDTVAEIKGSPCEERPETPHEPKHPSFSL